MSTFMWILRHPYEVFDSPQPKRYKLVHVQAEHRTLKQILVYRVSEKEIHSQS